MIVFKVKRPQRKLVEMDKVIIEVIKDGEKVASIFPNEEGIRIVCEKGMKKIECNNGEDFVPAVPLVEIHF